MVGSFIRASFLALLLGLCAASGAEEMADDVRAACRIDPDEQDVDAILHVAYRCQEVANNVLRVNRSAYDAWSLRHRQNALLLQERSSVAWLSISVLVFLFGIGLSFLEFRRGSSGTHHIKLSKDGLELSSKVLGLVILVVALAFAYLYLEKVYPINEIEDSNGEVSVADSTDADG